MRVLLADDDPSVAKLLKFKLEKEKIETGWAQDGDKALEMALGEEWDVLLLDIMMPVNDGFWVLRQLQEKKPGLPVIILSARGQEKDVLYGLELGAQDYISKPFRPAEVVARVKRLKATGR